MIWDHLYGTYEPENEPVTYGLTKPINSVNPWKVHFEDATRLVRKLRQLKTVRAKLRLLVSGLEVSVTDAA